MVKQKLKEWGKRYLPGEIAGTITAVAAASIAHIFYNNLLFIAYVGSIGEAIGFYSTVLVQNLIRVKQDCRLENRNFTVTDFRKIVTRIALEFGPAGIIDDLLIRPFFMYWFPIILNNFILGILIGKFVGDFAFYILVIVSYEFNKRYKKTKWIKN